MSTRGLICSKCSVVKEQNQFSKAQIKKGEGRICKDCMTPNPNSNTSTSQISGNRATTVERPAIFKPLIGAEGDKADKMMCLTMHQPWASLLVYGIKRVEGRGWNTDFRGRLWIHAGISCFVISNRSCQRTEPRGNCWLWSKIPRNLSATWKRTWNSISKTLSY